MKSRLQRYLLSAAAFFLPVFCLCFYFIRSGITPFGGGTFLIHDMNAQYVDFFSYLRTILSGENDLLYSLSLGAGSPLPAFFAYYLACPLNLIPILFPDASMPTGITLEMLLLFGLTGLSCFYCLRRLSEETSPLLCLYLSAAWSFSAWMVLNAENFQFIQEAAVLPMLICSLEKLKREGKQISAILWLTTALILNFYIGAMLWLFALLWLIIPSDRNVPVWQILMVFLAAFLLSSPVWLTVLQTMGYTIKQTSPDWYAPRINFTFPELLRKFLPGQFDASAYQDHGLPAVYCGLLTLAGTVFYFFTGKFTAERRHHIILLVIMMISLCYHPLTMIWHGFSEPHWWPYRFSFLFIFLLILCAARSRIPVPALLLIPCLAGLIFNLDKTFSVKLVNQIQLQDYAATVTAKAERLSVLTSGDRELYRIEDLSPRSDNDAMHFSTSGITTFNSLADRRVIEFLSAMGFPLERYTLRYGAGNTLFANLLQGVRYVLDGDRIVENGSDAGLVFRIGHIAETLDLSEIDAMTLQNMLAASLGAASPVLSPVKTEGVTMENLDCDEDFCWKEDPVQDAYIHYTLAASRDGFLYAHREQPSLVGKMAFQIGDRNTELSAAEHFLPLCPVRKGKTVRLDLNVSAPVSDLPEVSFILEDTDAVRTLFTEAFCDISVKKVSSSELQISIPSVSSEIVLAVTLPYDSHWRAEAAGMNLRIKPLWDVFMQVRIPAGTEEITLKYQ